MKSLKKMLAVVLSLSIIATGLMPMNVDAAKKSAVSKKKITIRSTLLKDDTVLLKVTNKNSKTVTLSIKITYYNNERIIGEDTTGIYGLKAKTTIYDAVSSALTIMKDDLRPTKVKVKFSLKSNYYKPQLKSISGKLNAKITSVETNNSFNYQTFHIDITNKSKKKLSGDVVVAFYSGGKMVAAEDCFISVRKGETSFEEISPFIFVSDYEPMYNIDSIKLFQHDVRYSK